MEWAYNTLPEKIRNLPDFPGIQVGDCFANDLDPVIEAGKVMSLWSS